MQASEPPQAAMEEATAHLLRLALIEIRFLTSPLQEDQSTEAVTRRSSAAKRQWLRSRWDHLEHDHRWLTDTDPESMPAETAPSIDDA